MAEFLTEQDKRTHYCGVLNEKIANTAMITAKSLFINSLYKKVNFKWVKPY